VTIEIARTSDVEQIMFSSQRMMLPTQIDVVFCPLYRQRSGSSTVVLEQARYSTTSKRQECVPSHEETAARCRGFATACAQRSCPPQCIRGPESGPVGAVSVPSQRSTETSGRCVVVRVALLVSFSARRAPGRFSWLP